MSNYLLRWYSNGDDSEETFTDQAAVLARISELAVSGKECQLYEQIPVKLRVTASLPRRYRNGSPAGSPNNARPPGVPAAEPAGDVFDAGSGQSREAATPTVGSEDPAASRTGLTEVAAAGGAERQLTPQKPAAAPEGPRWGRIGTPELGAWHRWASADDAEAACGETIGPEVEVVFLDHGMKMEPDQICTECDEIDGQTVPAPGSATCEHKNEAAGVPCNAKATAGKGIEALKRDYEEHHVCAANFPDEKEECDETSMCGRATAALASTSESAPQPTPPSPDQIEYVVQRFLNWRLPENFSPDAGISFKPTFNDHMPFGPMRHNPVGTNLFDHTEAMAMVRYMLDGMPAPAPQPPIDNDHVAPGCQPFDEATIRSSQPHMSGDHEKHARDEPTTETRVEELEAAAVAWKLYQDCDHDGGFSACTECITAAILARRAAPTGQPLLSPGSPPPTAKGGWVCAEHDIIGYAPEGCPKCIAAAPPSAPQEALREAFLQAREALQSVQAQFWGTEPPILKEAEVQDSVESALRAIRALPLPESALLTKAAPLTQPAVPEKEQAHGEDRGGASQHGSGCGGSGAETSGASPAQLNAGGGGREVLRGDEQPRLPAVRFDESGIRQAREVGAAPAPVETRLTKEES